MFYNHIRVYLKFISIIRRIFFLLILILINQFCKYKSLQVTIIVKQSVTGIMKQNILNKEFYQQGTERVAKQLIGKIFVKKEAEQILSARIVETEAYLSENDLSSHSAVGQTKRNAPMFDCGGILYVYQIYGVHHCINIVSQAQDIGAAVLIRAMEVIEGTEIFKSRRGENVKREKLLSGPGNIAKAFAFTKADNYHSLLSDDLYIIEEDEIPDSNIITTKRIGITKSEDLLLRFIDINSKSITKRNY